MNPRQHPVSACVLKSGLAAVHSALDIQLWVHVDGELGNTLAKLVVSLAVLLQRDVRAIALLEGLPGYEAGRLVLGGLDVAEDDLDATWRFAAGELCSGGSLALVDRFHGLLVDALDIWNL